MISHVLQPAPVAAYAALAGLVGGESAGIPLPGETSLVAAALLAAQHRLSLPLVVATAAAAAIVGDNVGYLVGRSGVRSLLVGRGPLRARRRALLYRGERFFARRGRTAVFFGRWVPSLRVTVAWLAGAGRMRWRTFAVWNALGAVAWATAIGTAVYAAGAAAQRDLRLLALGVVGVGVIATAARVAPLLLAGARLRKPGADDERNREDVEERDEYPGDPQDAERQLDGSHHGFHTAERRSRDVPPPYPDRSIVRPVDASR